MDTVMDKMNVKSKSIINLSTTSNNLKWAVFKYRRPPAPIPPLSDLAKKVELKKQGKSHIIKKKTYLGL